MFKKIFTFCLIAFQLQAIDIFQAVEVNDKLAVRQWLRSKLDVHILNDQGQSLLHVAVQAGNRSLVKQLLKKKIDVNIIDQHSKAAMDYAVELGFNKIAFLLVRHGALMNQYSSISNFYISIKKKQSFWSKIFPISVLIAIPILWLSIMPILLSIAYFVSSMIAFPVFAVLGIGPLMVDAGSVYFCVKAKHEKDLYTNYLIALQSNTTIVR